MSAAPGCDGTHLYVGTDGGEVVALSVGDGSVQWQRATGNRPLATLVIDGERVIAIDPLGAVHGLRCDTGELQFSRQLGTSMREPPVVTGGRVIAVTDEGDLEALVHQLFEPA